MNAEAREFLLKEYDALRREIEIGLNHIHTIFYHALIACGAIWIWFNANQEIVRQNKVVLWLPLFIVLFSFLRNFMVKLDMKKIGSYIKRIETEIKLPSNLGWETSLIKGKWYSPSDWWEFLYWIVLALLNFLLIKLF